MITEKRLSAMMKFAETDTWRGAMYDTISTLVEEVRRLKREYEPELTSDCDEMDEHEKMYSCANYIMVDNLMDKCRMHPGEEFEIDEPPETGRYNPLWEVCKSCNEWKCKKRKRRRKAK